MRREMLALSFASGLAFAASGAAAETYTIRQGSLIDAATGETRSLSGAFDASVFEVEGAAEPAPTVLIVDDFQLESGAQSFVPARAVEYDGRRPLFGDLILANQIQLEDGSVTLALLRAGGEVVAESDDLVTFRFFEFRADASPAGRASGRLGDGSLPRSLSLEGTLYEVEQSYSVPDASTCPSPSLGGGGVIIGSDPLVLWEPFDIEASGTVEFQPPTSGAVITRVIGGDPVQIEGDLRVDGSVYLLSPAGVVYDSSFAALPLSISNEFTPVPVVPTLEQLGMRAPGGAVVTFDATGALRVDATGDLFVEGVFPEIPGLTSLTLTATGSIEVTGSLQLPPGVPVHLDTRGNEVGDPTDPPPVVLPGWCTSLRSIHPAPERELGHFTLVASAAQPVEIDVLPGSERNRVHPGSHQLLPVALLGSQQLDVRDVDPGLLRLGAGEAEPVHGRWLPRSLRLDLNRDRHADLLAFFELREAEVAFGDTQLCLVAETHDGVVLEGCDAIDASPRALQPPPAAGSPGLRTLRERLRR